MLLVPVGCWDMLGVYVFFCRCGLEEGMDVVA